MLKRVMEELEHHAPFTFFGALTGIVLMALFHKLSFKASYNTFYILHPAHVLLSAMVTASMYKLHNKSKFLNLIIIGYIGSVGVATISDSLIPYWGEALLRLPKREAHIGFIEEWWIVNPMAFLGVALAYLKPRTKFPHFLHVFVSTWASLFHIVMAVGGTLGLAQYLGIFIFLFVAVWFPCCTSDIIFPLLFVKGKDNHKHEI